MNKDLIINELGDIDITPTGNARLREDTDNWGVNITNIPVQAQEIFIRLFTYLGDYRLYPSLGNIIPSLIGSEYTQSLHGQIKSTIVSALSDLDYIQQVTCLPSSYTTVRIMIDFISQANKTSRMIFTLDMIEGLKVVDQAEDFFKYG